MRTNIEIDDELMAEVRELSPFRTKRAIVEAALREYRRWLAMGELLDMQGKVEFFEGYDPEDHDDGSAEPWDAELSED
jgi:Arc/MetJ family transcription regulator